MTIKDERPHIDAVSGQAAWMLGQILAMRLVKNGVISKAELREDLQNAAYSQRTDPHSNPAVKGSSVLLAQLADHLQTADGRDGN